jgi:hypothetical protein
MAKLGLKPPVPKAIPAKRLPVTEAEPAVYESGTSNSSNELKTFELQAPKNLKKNTTYSRKKRDSTKPIAEGIQPWAICEAIAEAGGLEFFKPSGRSLREAKSLLQAWPDLSVESVKAITLDLLANDGGSFWNVKQPVTPSAVERHLPLWRKRENSPQVQPVSQTAPLDLAAAWAQQEAR